MTSRTFTATIVLDGSSCLIALPFDPKAAFGKVRAPVTVTLNGYTFRSTIAAMGGPPCVPLRRSHREAAGLSGGETLKVTVALDTAPRVVTPPADLLKALKAAPSALDAWAALSFTHQREHVEAIEGAKTPETRARRVANAIAFLANRPARPARPVRPARKARRAQDQATADAGAGRSSTTRSGGTHSARARTSPTTSKL